MAKKNTKITKLRKRRISPVTILISGIIAMYFIYNIFLQITEDPVSTYEVQQGAIVANSIYKGLIIRSEQVIYAEQEGDINYYMKSGSKVAVTDPIFSIDTEGSISSLISQASESAATLDQTTYNSLLDNLGSFTGGYSSGSYEKVYSFKQDFSSELNQNFSTKALNSISSEVLSSVNGSTFFLYYPSHPGVIAHYVDGKESLTTNTYTASDMDSTGYKKEQLDIKTKVNKSDPIYKIITSETWNVILSIPQQLAEDLKERTVVKIRFCKDNFTINAACTIDKRDGSCYLNLRMKSGMIRYLNDRYADVELILNDENGLKIPISAITRKEFYEIPAACFVEGGDNNKPGLMIIDSDGDAVFTEVTIYDSNEEVKYIRKEDLPEGTKIQYADIGSTYTVGEDTVLLEGVYNVNKGYTVFALVHVLSRNNDYAVIQSGTSYGIQLYDHIALNASKLSEGQTIIK